MIRLGLAALAASFLFAGTAHAQMVSAQNPQTIVSALQSAGYRAELDKDTTGDPMIRSSSGGSAFYVFFYRCTRNTDCRTVQFYAGFADARPSLSQMNEWNSKNYFGRAYIRDNGSARLEMDIDLDDGGVSRAVFGNNLEFWVVLMGRFKSFVGA